MKGIATKTMQPIIITLNQTVLLPVDIWLGGMKLKMKASNEPKKPTPPTIHIRELPFLPILKARGASFMI